MRYIAYFFNPNTGSSGLAELSKVAVEQEGDAPVRRARLAPHANLSCSFLLQRDPSLSRGSNIGPSKQLTYASAELTNGSYDSYRTFESSPIHGRSPGIFTLEALAN